MKESISKDLNLSKNYRYGVRSINLILGDFIFICINKRIIRIFASVFNNLNKYL